MRVLREEQGGPVVDRLSHPLRLSAGGPRSIPATTRKNVTGSPLMSWFTLAQNGSRPSLSLRVAPYGPFGDR